MGLRVVFVLCVVGATAACPDGNGRPDGAAGDAAGDAGPMGQDAAVSCGELTYIGACAGGTVTYCQQGTPISLACDVHFGPTATCGLVDCIDPTQGCVGYYCVQRPGTPCGRLGCDVALGMGCLDGLCARSVACDPASYTATCRGDALTSCSGVVSELDCATRGSYHCGTNAQGLAACLGAVGALCDLAHDIDCEPALECGRNGRCAPPDAGLPIDAGRARDATPGEDATPEDTGHRERGGEDRLAEDGHSAPEG